MVDDPRRQCGAAPPDGGAAFARTPPGPRERCQKDQAMPTYEYACPTCGIVEAFQSIKEAALTRCPCCKKAKVQRMISGGGGVIFKGSGFYETDYRSESYKKAKEADAKAASGASDAKPDDSKPADAKSEKPADTKAGGKSEPAPAQKAEKKPEAAPPAEPRRTSVKVGGGKSSTAKKNKTSGRRKR
jgi:putative FmdB family regulatory protein